MLNNILELKGVTQLNKNEQQTIQGELTDYGDQYTCMRLCGGHCTYTGLCYEHIK